jgi:hypothetical protein
MTTKAHKITATAENGEIFTRKTARTYSHAVYLEFTYSDGTVKNGKPSWAGRPDLAGKSLKDTAKVAAKYQGTKVHRWNQEVGKFIFTGIFYDKVRAICVPVNA